MSALAEIILGSPDISIRNRWHSWICLPIGLVSGVIGWYVRYPADHR